MTGRIVITGAAGAIGGAVARAFRARDPLAVLVPLDRDARGLDRLQAELGGPIEPVVADLCNETGQQVALRALEGADGLVNAAGIMSVAGLEALPWERGQDILTIDLVAPLRLMQAHVAALRTRPDAGAPAFVVNVTSMAGRVPLMGCAFYGAAKAGLSMASEIARAELAPHGIRVVTVYPGPVRSALEAGARAQYAPSRAATHIPVGDPEVLGRLIVDAVASDRGRLIYPLFYRLGVAAPGLAARVALGLGPAPLA